MLIKNLAGRVSPTVEAQLRRYLATAYLRKAEEDNCQMGANPRACLLPIRGGGVHENRAGATSAARELEHALELDPDDLAARWLLNLAYMTLGEHPEGVAEPWRIDAEIFGDSEEFVAFENVAARAGVQALALSGGVVLEDLNGDAALDIMISSWGLRDPLRVFVNDGSGRFDERTESAGLVGITGGLNLKHADYDNDGDVDVLVLRGAWLGAGGATRTRFCRIAATRRSST